jgi:dTDP-4-dehydrorhamnose 3,5-epimerase
MSAAPDPRWMPAVDAAAAPSLVPSVQEALRYQEYGQRADIEGVWIRRVPKHRAENGSFMELFRLSRGRIEQPDGETMELRQISVSSAAPGRINAFHIHPKLPQNEVWLVLEGVLLVWLVDCRAGSGSSGVRKRVILAGEDPHLLHIPAGVAHGYRAGAAGALLVYGMDQQFDPADPNEGRLPWDHFGAELWAEDRG